MHVATMTSEGQITIPKSIRELFHLHAGDRLEFIVENEDRIVVKPATVDITELRWMLTRPGQPIASIEDMNRDIAIHVAQYGFQGAGY